MARESKGQMAKRLERENQELQKQLAEATDLIQTLKDNVPIQAAVASEGVKVATEQRDIYRRQRDRLVGAIEEAHDNARRRLATFQAQDGEKNRDLAQVLARTLRQPPIVLKMISTIMGARIRLMDELDTQYKVDVASDITLYRAPADPMALLRNTANMEFWAALYGLSSEVLQNAVYMADDIYELVAEAFAEMKAAKDHRPRMETLKLIGKDFLQREVTKEPASFEKIQKYLGYGYTRKYIRRNVTDEEFCKELYPELGDPRELRRCNDYLRRFEAWLLPIAIEGGGSIDDLELEPGERVLLGVGDHLMVVDYDDLQRLRADRQ